MSSTGDLRGGTGCFNVSGIMSLSSWMSWEGGVDLVGLTDPGLSMPNVIVHVARMVHTPVGSAPAGMIFWQPDPAAPPEVMGFFSPDEKVAAYFGPQIFAGTPFESAPALVASISVEGSDESVSAKIEVGGRVFETEFSALEPSVLVAREPAATAPFFQQGLERKAGRVALKVDGKSVDVIVPPVGISGGPAAVSSPCGIYAR